MTRAALESGKHVMCTVPMATSVEDCRKIMELSARTGLRSMIAETVVYAREPYSDARQSANWTCTGLLGHESALAGGQVMKLPEWTCSGQPAGAGNRGAGVEAGRRNGMLGPLR